MAIPDPQHAMRVWLLSRSAVTSLLLPQTALPSLAVAPIFAYDYPRKVAGAPATGATGHDLAALLNQKAIRLVLISPSGRVQSGGDTTRAPWSRPRMDVQIYGRSASDAMAVHLAIEEELKALSNARATLAGGVASIRDVTVEGGPIEFPDPDTDAPIVTGIYAASFAEQYVA